MTKPTLQIIGLLLFCNITILSNLNAQTTNQAAAYKGGQAAFLEYFAKNITFPYRKYDVELLLRIKLVMNIAIDGTAKIVDIKCGPISDQIKVQIERIVPNMPKWIPEISGNETIESTVFVELAYSSDLIVSAFYRTEGAQERIDIIERGPGKIISPAPVNNEKPFVTVEQMPTFGEGEEKMHEFIRTNLQYPEEARKLEIQGRVTLRFVVNEDGSISETRVIRGIDPECNKEAIRIVEAMPRWNAGRQNGVAVPVYFTLPIIFRLND